ncbi:S8 family peptidase [Streptomyces sp. NPDC003023]|uniref:S8 family peptidase n=1 Tax=Streptomyces sp. NPDC003023 TaxID=3364675 RepID=UPI0036CDE040
MKTRTLLRYAAAGLTAGAAVLTSLAPAAPAAPTGTHAPAAESSVYIVRINGVAENEDAVREQARAMTEQHGGQLRRLYFSAMQGFSAELTTEQIRNYLKDTRVDSVTGDRTYAVAGNTATRRGSGVQLGDVPWGLDRVDQRDLPLDRLYRFPGTADSVHVYVVDTGVRTGHREFAGRARGAYDAITQQTAGESGKDCHGHGTASAAVAAGTFTGVAKRARVESVRALGCNGTGTLEHLVSAVDWIAAHARKPAVVQLGFTGPPGSVLDLQLYQMTQMGIAYTAPAGNGDENGQGMESCATTPARQTTAITVAATGPDDTRPAWSNFGYCTHLFAPGTRIPAAAATGDGAYTAFSGTSAAAAHVAGAAALYLEAHPGASPEQIDQGLTAAATKDHVRDAGEFSKNLLLYTGAIDGEGRRSR